MSNHDYDKLKQYAQDRLFWFCFIKDELEKNLGDKYSKDKILQTADIMFGSFANSFLTKEAYYFREKDNLKNV